MSVNLMPKQEITKIFNNFSQILFLRYRQLKKCVSFMHTCQSASATRVGFIAVETDSPLDLGLGCCGGGISRQWWLIQTSHMI